MKRLQIRLDEALQSALEHEARRQGVAKAALVRSILRERIEQQRGFDADPLLRFVGSVDGAPNDSAPINDVVYASTPPDRRRRHRTS